MTFQVNLTQKKNGTFLAGVQQQENLDGRQRVAQVNSYKDAESFRAALKVAGLQGEAATALQEASARAERRPENEVSLEVADIEPGQLRRIGLN